MELIDFLIQIEGVGEREIKRSSVHLVVNQEEEESIPINVDSLVLHGGTIRNIMSESDVWHHYFKICNGNEENSIVVKSRVQHPFKLTRLKD